ncbi:MAG: ABC transporter permease [Epsilonproteobacteria bacterium]|nr:MAG: ABC transporter permease [Campylobacterota bacterium]
MKVFIAILLKELLSFVRSFGLVFIVIYFFTAEVFVAATGMEMEAKNVAIGVVDKSAGGISKKILSSLHSPEFQTLKFYTSQKELSDAVYNKEIMVGIIFDEQFEKNYYKKLNPTINILIDSTSASQSLMAIGYIQNILMKFSNLKLPVALKMHKLFNQNSDTTLFMGVSELLSIITLLTTILTAIVFVKEKESGTWDIMLLMPVDPKIVILAKSLSQIIIIMVGTVLSVGLILFHSLNVPINGNLINFFILTFFYVATTAGIGLFIAAISKNVMQISQLSIVIMMPIIFLSGAWTPVYAMHPLLQYLSILSPLRYYIEGSESIFFRGSSFVDLLPYFGGVLILGVFLYWFGFRKIGKLF